VEYQLSPAEKPDRLTLDDFIYQQAPTDQIVERIEKYVRPGLVQTRPAAASRQTHSAQTDTTEQGGDEPA